MRLRALLLAVVVVLATGTARASQLIDRNATAVKLAVNAKGEALLTYRTGGHIHRVLAWGAVDARPPTRGRAQIRFKKDYSGGWGKYRTLYWQRFRDACRFVANPPLHEVAK